MDLTDTIIPKSDQLNADDLIAGPRTFTIKSVDPGSSEQPVNVHLVEAPGHPYRPSKSMRRVMVHAWGKDTTNYPGRRLTLYRDPTVKFGGMEVGGIKISHLSHIEGPMSIALTVTRGKRDPHPVKPLTDDAPPDHVATIRAHMERLGMQPGDLLRVASETAGRVIGHPAELTDTEAADLIERLSKE